MISNKPKDVVTCMCRRCRQVFLVNPTTIKYHKEGKCNKAKYN